MVARSIEAENKSVEQTKKSITANRPKYVGIKSN